MITLEQATDLLNVAPHQKLQKERKNGRIWHYDIDQNTEEWFRLRMGKITASPSATLLTDTLTSTGKVKIGSWDSLGKGAVAYAEQIADEIFNPTLETDGYSNNDMMFGHINEDFAAVEFMTRKKIELRKIGFVQLGHWMGVSPDRICVDKDAGWETKSANRKVHRNRLLRPESFRKEHNAQCQFSMYVTGFDRWYLCSYNGSYDNSAKLLITTIFRDEDIMEKFKEQIPVMIKKIEKTLIKLQKYK